MKHGIALDIIIRHAGWRRIPKLRTRLEQAAAAIEGELPKSLRFPFMVTVLLTGDGEIRRLNRDFRGIDRPTNVLSFPQITPSELTKLGKRKGKPLLGDIALGYQYMVDETKKDHKILINHVGHLLVHGILHILGYDHVSGAGAVRMERLEKKVMAKLGLPDPYAPQPREPKVR